jgi:hypothetical protein
VNDPQRSLPNRITPERWAELEPHVDAILELPRDARAEYLARVSASDESLGRQLAHLVNDLDRDSSLIAAAGADRSSLLKTPLARSSRAEVETVA